MYVHKKAYILFVKHQIQIEELLPPLDAHAAGRAIEAAQSLQAGGLDGLDNVTHLLLMEQNRRQWSSSRTSIPCWRHHLTLSASAKS